MESDARNPSLAATRSIASSSSVKEGDRCYLLVLEGGSSRMFHLPSHGMVLIGRTSEAELQLHDDSVSRRHARITVVDGEASVSDLSSYNGTRVNGERISGSHELSSGDVVSVGDVLLVLHRTSREPKPRATLSKEAALRRIAEEIARAQESERAFSLLVVRFSDGPLERSKLELTAQGRLRLIDATSWIGERELLVILPEQEPATARRVATALLSALLLQDGPVRIGLATHLRDGSDPEALCGAARSAAASAQPATIQSAAEAVTRLSMDDREILLADPAMLGLFDLLKRLARSDIHVLIRGETGAGKENAAYAVHYFSSRREKPFVAVNCAAIAETLIESELFGHERGAFSGATHSKPGLLEAAAGGTVFLDEVGELSAGAQSKLLRALESKRITRVGDVKEREVDIRIVAATHRDLEAMARAKQFREDLFFRLGAATVILPPLRERPREVGMLAQSFLKGACERLRRSSLLLSHQALRALCAYVWPGNVRELRNAMEYVAAVVTGNTVEAHHLPPAIASVLHPSERAEVSKPATERPLREAEPAQAFRPIAEELRELERRRMQEALRASGGVRKQAAELISMPLRTFTLKLKQYGLGGADTDGEQAESSPE